MLRRYDVVRCAATSYSMPENSSRDLLPCSVHHPLWLPRLHGTKFDTRKHFGGVFITGIWNEIFLTQYTQLKNWPTAISRWEEMYIKDSPTNSQVYCMNSPGIFSCVVQVVEGTSLKRPSRVQPRQCAHWEWQFWGLVLRRWERFQYCPPENKKNTLPWERSETSQNRPKSNGNAPLQDKYLERIAFWFLVACQLPGLWKKHFSTLI